MIEGWRYYNHALLPATSPHIVPDISRMKEKEFWKNSIGRPVLARWTTDFDCEQEQNWWYVIKDNCFDISELKAKRRYEINKGKKNFEVEIINPAEYIDDLVNIQKKAYEVYPAKYRPTVSKLKMENEISTWNENVVIYGAFSIEQKELVGYAMIIKESDYANFAMLKTIPLYERQGINAAIVASILESFNEAIDSGYYICDGERSLLHETNFQDYLEKYFGFRKAYCKLHVAFRFPYSIILNIISNFPEKLFRGALLSKVKVLLQFKKISDENKYQEDRG